MCWDHQCSSNSWTNPTEQLAGCSRHDWLSVVSNNLFDLISPHLLQGGMSMVETNFQTKLGDSWNISNNWRSYLRKSDEWTGNSGDIFIMIYGIFLVAVCNQRSDMRPGWWSTTGWDWWHCSTKTVISLFRKKIDTTEEMICPLIRPQLFTLRVFTKSPTMKKIVKLF